MMKGKVVKMEREKKNLIANWVIEITTLSMY